MVTRELNKHKVVFYDNVEDLPIVQFHRYSKYLLVEGGIGDTIQDIDKHISRIMNYLGDAKKAHQELLNLRQCLYMVATEQDIHNKTTLCLVKSVDGKCWEDFSDSGLDELYNLIQTSAQKELDELSEELRGKIDSNLSQYFPHIFEDASQKNYIDLVRKRALLQIGEMVNGEDNKKEIEEVTKKMYESSVPKNFNGQDSEEIKFDKQFEDMCLSMAREFGGGIKKFTTMEFYTAFERLSRESNELKKRRKK